MEHPVCYLGDDHLGGAAAYLAGVLTHCGAPLEHVQSDAAPPAEFLTRTYAAYVLSDYPAARLGPEHFTRLFEAVRAGSGLLMIGGWESFFGRLGEYHCTPLTEVLPVIMASADDRRNCAQPCLVRPLAEHPILAGLPWETPPGIGGYNAFTPKAGAQTLLAAVPFTVRREGTAFEFMPGPEIPLLVVGAFGRGRTAALATDVAPHWVGGWVDWGDRRVTQEVGPGFIEVGNHYAQFFANLVRWVAGDY